MKVHQKCVDETRLCPRRSDNRRDVTGGTTYARHRPNEGQKKVLILTVRDTENFRVEPDCGTGEGNLFWKIKVLFIIFQPYS